VVIFSVSLLGLLIIPALVEASPGSGGGRPGGELVDTQTETSPDGRNRLETQMWNTEMGCRIEIVLHHDNHLVLTRTIPPEDDVRSVRLAWSPSSETALVGLYQKAAEQLLLVRIVRGRATSTLLNHRGFIDETMLNILPFRQDIASIAPRTFFSWKTISWRIPGICLTDYRTRGVGYEGTARVEIDFRSSRPRLKVLTVEPTAVGEFGE
jgi:hypothetical protein